MLLRAGLNEMPAVGRGWTDAQLDTLFEFTRTVGEGQ